MHNANALPRRCLRKTQAALYLGIPLKTFEKWVVAGRLPEGTQVDTFLLWDIRDLDQAADNLFSKAADGVYKDESEENPWHTLGRNTLERAG